MIDKSSENALLSYIIVSRSNTIPRTRRLTESSPHHEMKTKCHVQLTCSGLAWWFEVHWFPHSFWITHPVNTEHYFTYYHVISGVSCDYWSVKHSKQTHSKNRSEGENFLGNLMIICWDMNWWMFPLDTELSGK